jgi:hypothetical protein
MATQTDVKAVYLSATGLAGIAGLRNRVKGIWMATPVGAGSVVIRDGSATGVTLIKFDTAAAITNDYMLLPGEGVLSQADLHVTLTSVTSVTIFYG